MDIGWILDGEYACFDGFLDGSGGGLGWLLDDLGLILMDFGCLLGWCLDGF